MILIAITRPARKLLYSAVTTGLVLVTAIITTFLAANQLSGTVTIGVSPPLNDYLREYQAAFCRVHPEARIEFVIFDTEKTGENLRDPGVDVLLIPGRESASFSRRQIDTIYLKFAPVVSPFSPVEEISLSALQKIYSGQLVDWRHVCNDWDGPVEIVTYRNNPGNHLIIPALTVHLPTLDYQQHLPTLSEAVDYISFHPRAIGILPLIAVSAGTNLVRVRDSQPPSAVDSSLLACPVSVVRVASPLTGGLIGRWRRNLQSKFRILHAFLEFVRNTDQRNCDSDPVILRAVGDIMLNRRVGQAIRQHGVTHPFAATQSLLSSADVTFGNLETPISDRGWLLNMFRADPEVTKGLRHAGIDVVSIANNHILDFDDPALFDTISLLEKENIKTVGAGKNLTLARKPAFFHVKNTTIAFLAYSELWFCHTKTFRRYDATDHNSGVAPLVEEYVLEDVRKAARKADLVVVSFHWGREYSHFPTEVQERFARVAIDAGAHLVLGHHPHVLQGIDFYKDGVILYSLGNFIFDQTRPGTQDTIIATLTISGKRILRLDLAPGWISDYQPRLLTGEAKAGALENLWRYSCYRNR